MYWETGSITVNNWRLLINTNSNGSGGTAASVDYWDMVNVHIVEYPI